MLIHTSEKLLDDVTHAGFFNALLIPSMKLLHVIRIEKSHVIYYNISHIIILGFEETNSVSNIKCPILGRDYLVDNSKPH